MKYIIEIKPEYEDTTKGIMVLGARDSKLFVDTVDVANLEVLNSDYINEHFGELQDTAYQKGINDGSLDVKQRVEGAYQKGFEDGRNETWDAAWLIFNMSDEDAMEAGLDTAFNLSASEAIAKLKAYEEKQKADDEIKVGDEVIYNDTMKCLVVRPETDERYAVLIDGNGNHHHACHSECKKTGRHFDIASILEAMKK